MLCLTSYIFVMYGGRGVRGKGGSVLRESCTDTGDTKVPKEAEVLWHINTVLLVLLGEIICKIQDIPICILLVDLGPDSEVKKL